MRPERSHSILCSRSRGLTIYRVMLRRVYDGGGEHTEEVLLAFGYSKEEIEDLRRENVV